ncbi:sugar transferase [Arthrobacter sp. ISL-69]|uniref:sugar transferase n=1 Tax=Arthrobacter sp. ISL-69 TaxID=2819113 RepID=UPI00288A5DC6|nr:sugar transferase [Arthrobacter sp. ISL-69]
MTSRIESKEIAGAKNRPLDYVRQRHHLTFDATAIKPALRRGASLAGGTLAAGHVEPAGKHRSGGKRLWSAQRFVLLLVLLDLAIGLGIAFVATLTGSMDSLADVFVFASWLMVWFVCSTEAGAFSPLGGFSSRRDTLETFALSIRSGATALAVCVVIAVVVGQEQGYLELIEVIVALSLLSGVARVFLTRLSSPRVLVVTLETDPLPAGYGPNLTFRHLPVAADLLDQPDLLVARIAEAAKAFDACTVEIVGDVGLSGQLWRSLSWELREQHASLRFAVAGGPLRQRRVRCAVKGPRVVLEISAPVQPLAVRLGKRCTDIAGSLCLILALSPLLIALAILVKLTSRGPALYGQERVGKNGALFNILKFRSMADGSDAQLQSLLKQQDKADTPLFKVDNDPRITRVGAVLRRYSLDELPQLFNVLAGSMSLVGPRPQRPAEVALYRGDAAHRLGVPPGMTGLWQVSGRSRLSWDEAQQLDIDYAHNWSLWEDLHILARTARAVFGADGAR